MGNVKTKRKKWLFTVIILCFVGVIAYVVLNIPFSKIIVFNNLAYVTQAELESLEKDNYFGPFISANIKENDVINTSSQKEKSEYEPEIEFKLFNLIPIKSKKVKIIKEDKVLAGGTAIGLVLKTDGVLIVGSSLVSTPEGEVDVLEYDNLRIGDIIKQIENETVENVSSISKIINEEKNKGKDVCVIVSHSNCYSLCNHPRNLDDEQILSLKEFNPVIGLVSYGPFVSSSTDIGQLRKEYVEHIKHVISLLGEGAVGVSTDDMKFDYELLGNSDDIQLFPYKSIGNELEKLLKEKGISNVKKIMFENSYNKLFRRNFEFQIFKRQNKFV